MARKKKRFDPTYTSLNHPEEAYRMPEPLPEFQDATFIEKMLHYKMEGLKRILKNISDTWGTREKSPKAGMEYMKFNNELYETQEKLDAISNEKQVRGE